MGHDHHFLERLDRVEREHLEYALGLYRDHEALRYVLSKIDAADERVALAIGSVQRGPYVVVANNGHFVTCLGEGMSPGRLQVIPRERLDALRARYKDQRTREQIADDLRREGEGDLAFFTRIFDRADAMCREEFVALSAFAPLLARQFYVAALSSATDFMSELGPIAKASKIKPADVPFARGLNRSYWFAAHAILVAALDDGRALAAEIPALAKMGITLTGGIALLGSMTHLLRSAWVAAQVGEPAVSSYEAHLASAALTQFALPDIASLGAIACRHERLKPQVMRIFARAATQAGHDEHETAVMRALIEAMVGIVDDRDGVDNVLVYGRALYQVLSQHLPAGDPHRIEAENVPDSLAKPALFGCSAGVDGSDALQWALLAIPAVARASAEDFYFEREVARKVCPEWTPQATLDIVHGLAKSGLIGGLTVVAEPKPGRNEPCPCGSGKKYKKCHGA